MDANSFAMLLTPIGQEALQAAEALRPDETDFLRCHAALSRRFSPALAQAAVETAVWRIKARSKFTLADRMYFTREALEQATGEIIAGYRSRRYSGCAAVVDLGCSIGGDLLALAQVAPTIGVDLDPLRLRIAQANLSAAGLIKRALLIQADILDPLPIAAAAGAGIFFDPARRAAGKRIFSVKSYRPPLEAVLARTGNFPAVGVKISPGVNLDELRGHAAEIEFISVNGELKEAVLWFGSLRTAGRRATLLPGDHSLEAETPDDELPPADPAVERPHDYLYEPDSAVLRAGLVRRLGKQIDAAQLDPDIAYLTADHLTATPFARAWKVETWLPFNLKRLRAVLRSGGVNRVTVKKRGSPLEPDALIQALRLGRTHPGEVVERTVFLTRLRGRPIAVICFTNPVELNPPQPPASAGPDDRAHKPLL